MQDEECKSNLNGLSEYEAQRQKNIAERLAFLNDLNIPEAKKELQHHSPGNASFSSNRGVKRVKPPKTP